MAGPSKTEHATEAFVWRLFNELDKKIDSLREEQAAKFDKVMSVLDDVMGQFRKFDEEREILTHRVSDNTERVEKLEKEVLSS